MGEIRDYICSGFEKCTRISKFDDAELIGIPYPYTVPSEEAFNELYYWDTYFTNVGLIKLGMTPLAKHNTDNILYLVDKYGFMPNGNRTYYLNRSQPPFLSEMVRDIYEQYSDSDWLEGAYGTLKKEYTFWMTSRTTPMGLNKYDSALTCEEIKECAAYFRDRINFDIESDDRSIARHGLVTAESGWDMNPRWKLEGYNYAHVDLNSLLFLFEKNMAYFSSVLNKKEEELWNGRSERRSTLMNEFLCTNDGLFFDYDYINGCLGEIFSVASFYPLFAKMATTEQAEAIISNLFRIEEKYGVACCEKNDCPITYQWNHPNGWAPLQYIIVKSLENYGYTDEAKRIANKYTSLVESVFDKTGRLWEKYNVVEGDINVQDEYKMPTMFGWTAGVYIALKECV